jgi:hypothetical protein
MNFAQCFTATNRRHLSFPHCCAAPHYLSVPEKVDLCSQAPPSKGQDPVRCLTAVAAAAKEFKNGPKKALGYFLESLWDAR